MERDDLIYRLKSTIREIPDFPKKGILFKDLTTIFKSNILFSETLDALTRFYEAKNITKVVGIEARGFIMGSALAARLNAGFVPIRKPGKLPAETLKMKYALEYGYDEIAIHKDALTKDDVVLLHDDLLATGGTISAAIELIEHFSVKSIYVNFICELGFLNGRRRIKPCIEVYSLVNYN